ncbi:MAG: hypothetical protein ACSHXG_12975 [Maribacter stanieri]
MYKPAIVVIAFNRPASLKRLLNSLAKAYYKVDNVKLIISIDYENSEENQASVKYAQEFDWMFGEKKVLHQKENLGLKNHVLSCGNLSYEYGSIIMLEDDIYVSKFYYQYSIEALDFYGNSKNIGGISLYNHAKNFLSGLPFTPIMNSEDTYFLQIASSWGQCWTSEQWRKFRNWLDESEDCKVSMNVPEKISNWPKSSWLKHFITYLVSNDLYFVYPIKSLSTNFGDGGTNNKNKNTEYQVPLLSQYNFSFISFDDSVNVYDAFFEIKPFCINKLNSFLKSYDYSVDLYGLKKKKDVNTEYLLTSKRARVMGENVKTFGLELKPITLNIIHEISGNVFCLTKTNNLYFNNYNFNLNNPSVFNYFYTKLSALKILQFLYFQLKDRF